MSDLFEKEWLEKNIFYDSLDENKLKHIFYFPILWNIFEKELCNNRASLNKYKEIASKININDKLQEINQIYNYFKQRYTSKYYTLSALRLPPDIERLIKENFNKEEIFLHEQVETLLCISFRLRNNLYHGIKCVKKLYEQNENFAQINKFLILVIERYNNDN